MIVFPNCKINLGLNIIRKRPDGFHDLETVFYPLPFHDALEIIHLNTEKALQDVSFTVSGIPVDGSPEENLCMKACRLLSKDFPDIRPLQMHLHKAIPPSGGLGGGSADAAFTLKLLNDQFKLNLSNGQLISYALQLGSDCPFFILNRACFATSRGEVLEAVDIQLNDYKFILVNPGVQVHTGRAFSQIAPSLPARSIRDIIKQPVGTWKDNLKNDFEKIVFSQFSEIRQIKDELYQAGAVYASMSGSGSTVYGIFEKGQPVSLSLPANCFVLELSGNL